MASYDWFLANLKKIGNPYAKDIGKTVYVIENKYEMKEAIILNIEYGFVKLKIFDKGHNQFHYKTVYLINKNKTWFTDKSQVEQIIEKRMIDDYNSEMVYEPKNK